MQTITIGGSGNRKTLYRQAAVLAWITVFYNVAEGVVSVFFGLEDETLALFGFGLDSFAEVISGIGILHMTRRLAKNDHTGTDRFESRALRITGLAFYILAAGLALTAAFNFYGGRAPESTFWGIVVAAVSIAAMWLLIHLKIRVGRRLESQAILADAECTRACMYLSLVLLISSAGYELTGLGGLDSAGAVLIALLSVREGREAFKKARGRGCGCDGPCGPTANPNIS
jgi:divalent metal cation (Fe/Co/Zn/Cd) transporter